MAKKIIYTVHIHIDNAIATKWQQWMLRIHIPDVMRTRCFDGTKISALVEPTKDGYQGFQIQYNTTPERFADYQSKFAARLQEAHTARYEGQFLASRFIVKEM